MIGRRGIEHAGYSLVATITVVIPLISEILSVTGYVDCISKCYRAGAR